MRRLPAPLHATLYNSAAAVLTCARPVTAVRRPHELDARLDEIRPPPSRPRTELDRLLRSHGADPRKRPADAACRRVWLRLYRRRDAAWRPNLVGSRIAAVLAAQGACLRARWRVRPGRPGLACRDKCVRFR